MKDDKIYGEVRKRCTVCKYKNTEHCKELVNNEKYLQIATALDMFLFADKFLCEEYRSMFI